MRNILLFAIIPCFLISACSKGKVQQEKIANNVVFYFQIEDQINTNFSRLLKQHMEENFPLRKYAITNSSGLTWPFYEEIPLNKQLSKDSIMSPHTFIHVLKPEEGQLKKEGDRMMKIIIFPNGNPQPAYSMSIYEWKNNDWYFEAHTGRHPIDSASFSTDNQLIEQFSKSIIRFSFK